VAQDKPYRQHRVQSDSSASNSSDVLIGAYHKRLPDVHISTSQPYSSLTSTTLNLLPLSSRRPTALLILLPERKRLDPIMPIRGPKHRLLIIHPINNDGLHRKQIHIPVIPGAKDRTIDNVPQSSRDNAFPDIQTSSEVGGTDPNADGDEEHVCDHMVEANGHESVDEPPDAEDLGDEFAALGAEDAGQADEPVAADAADEDLVPFGRDLFLGRESYGFFFVGLGGEDAADCGKKRGQKWGVWEGEVEGAEGGERLTAKDNACDKECACEICRRR
jgi:hypothetical protein